MQVGAHFLKDSFGNFVLDPVKDQVVQGVLTGTGMGDAAAGAGQNIDQAIHFYHRVRELYRVFFE